jgi:hypothetical protein
MPAFFSSGASSTCHMQMYPQQKIVKRTENSQQGGMQASQLHGRYYVSSFGPTFWKEATSVK